MCKQLEARFQATLRETAITLRDIRNDNETVAVRMLIMNSVYGNHLNMTKEQLAKQVILLNQTITSMNQDMIELCGDKND